TDAGPPDARQLVLGELTADLHQREVAEDRDLADVLPVQTALAGDRTDDRRGPGTMAVADPDAVRGVAVLGLRAAAPGALASGQRGPCLLLVLRARARPGIADRDRREHGCQLPRLHGDLLVPRAGARPVIADAHRRPHGVQRARLHGAYGQELGEPLAVEFQPAPLSPLGHLSEDRAQTVAGDVVLGGHLVVGEGLVG